LQGAGALGENLYPTEGWIFMDRVTDRFFRAGEHRWALLFVLALGLDPEAAWALQVHPAPTGLYAHQIAHLFFLLSMAAMALWLARNRLTQRPGWRFIQWSCLLFVLWNLGAIVGHAIDHRLPEEAFAGSGWNQQLVVERAILPYLYLLLRMDHLTCVPAMALLLVALRKFRKEVEGGRG
jgi:hypothetical protein